MRINDQSILKTINEIKRASSKINHFLFEVEFINNRSAHIF